MSLTWTLIFHTFTNVNREREMPNDQRLGEFEELILLAVWSLGESAYSVRIQEQLEEDAGRSASLGAIYAAMDRLERKRLVRSWVGRPTAVRGGRRKRFYALTEGGRAALRRLRATRAVLWGRIDSCPAGVTP